MEDAFPSDEEETKALIVNSLPSTPRQINSVRSFWHSASEKQNLDMRTSPL
jgi:hypothetical protein